MGNVYLIGYRCTGKSMIGAMVAERLGYSFIDADVLLVEEAGRPISEIVEAVGWPAFRALEKNLLARLSREFGLVVATGGGVILDPDNVGCMRGTGTVVRLSATPETVARRMGADDKTAGQRPALTDRGVMEEIRTVMAERELLYRSAAHCTVDTDDVEPGEVRDRVLQCVERED
ncbi:MAG: shikimate kinase [Desulfatibacillaceae bacterium]